MAEPQQPAYVLYGRDNEPIGVATADSPQARWPNARYEGTDHVRQLMQKVSEITVYDKPSASYDRPAKATRDTARAKEGLALAVA